MVAVRGGEARELEEPGQGVNVGREFAFSEADFRHLVQLAYQYAGISLSESKRNLLYSRLSRRLRTSTWRRSRSIAVCWRATSARSRISSTRSRPTTPSSSARRITSTICARTSSCRSCRRRRQTGNRRLRIWSAGCSSGEEPYTIGVVLKREIRDFRGYDVRILATDIDTDMLAKAGRGEFASATVDEVPKTYAEYFKRAGDKAVVDPEVKSLITFRQLNLMNDPWPFKGPFDAIFCRNVMIYFDGPTKAKLIQRFVQHIKPGGWLYIGHSESLIGTHPGLQSSGRTIYRRDD